MRTAILSLGVLASAAAAQPTPVPIDAVVQRHARAAAPGCAVASRSRDLIERRAFGLAELEHKVANTPTTIFEAGSVAKQFTAAAALLLVADGKLKLSDDVRHYVPELPDYGAPIRLTHLLSHTSGLRDWGSVAQLGGWERGERAHTNGDALRIIARQRSLNYPPGTEYSYTNSGYTLLAVIVERVSGQSLAAFSRDRIFTPLGLSSTSWRDDFRRIVPGRAPAYAPRAGGGWMEARPFEDAHGNGGLLTTVEDLLRWDQAVTAGRLGSGFAALMESRAVLSDGTRISYAAGVRVATYRGHPTVSHSGSTGGYRAWLERFPAQRLSIAVLCNGASLDAGGIGRELADALLPTSPQVVMEEPPALEGVWVSEATGRTLRLRPAPRGSRTMAQAGDRLVITTEDGRERFRRPDAAAAPALQNFVGRYASDEADASYDVAVDGTSLRLTLVSRPWITQRLEPSHADAFQSDNMIARFGRKSSGQVSAMRIGTPRVRDLASRRVTR